MLPLPLKRQRFQRSDLLNQKAKEAPLYIQVSSKDNVAIIVNDGGLPAGTSFSSGLTLTELIPQGHKVALKTIEQHAPIVRYGEIIGYANETIIQGSWVKEELVQMPAPPLDKLSCLTYSGPPLKKLDGYEFQGYRNPDHSVGTKNILGITTSVQCVVGVLDYAVKKIKEDLLPKYPNVDDVIPPPPIRLRCGHSCTRCGHSHQNHPKLSHTSELWRRSARHWIRL